MVNNANLKLDNAQIRECVANARYFLIFAKDVLGYPDDSQLGSLLTPRLNVGVVNSAFACELFLKAVIALESPDGITAAGHKITDLFGKISKGSQNLVGSCCAGGNPAMFAQYLAECDNAFVQWRYSHEAEIGIHPIFLFELAEALDKLLIEEFEF